MTLAQTIIDSTEILRSSKFARMVHVGLKEAEKFVFDRDASSAAKQVADLGAESVIKSLPLCRLPHRITWIELDRHVIAPNELEEVKGVGFCMLEPDGATEGEFAITIFYEDDEGYFGTYPFSILVYPKRNGQTFLDMMDVRVNPFAVEESNRMIGDVAKSEGMAGAGAVMAKVALSALAVLNSRNLVITEKAKPFGARAARRRGEREPMAYSTVRITLNRRDMSAAAADGMTQEEMRQHVVRGHFKVRKSGIYWWRPFIRGSIDVGKVVHTGYDITKAKAS